jgi:hypothetical protein
MVLRKKELNKIPVNIAAERLVLENALQNAIENDDSDQERKLKRKLADFDELKKDNQTTFHNSKMEIFSKLNSRNRTQNFAEGREAEKQATQDKKAKGNAEYDPFARRKTAPKHVVNK